MTDLVTILTSLVFIAFFVTTVVSILNGAPFVVTDKLTLATILKMSKIKKGSRVVDLGSGDGRIVMEFAKRGFETHGYEINLLLVFLSRIIIRRAGLTSIARIYGRSFWKINLAKYDLVVVYWINHIISRI